MKGNCSYKESKGMGGTNMQGKGREKKEDRKENSRLESRKICTRRMRKGKREGENMIGEKDNDARKLKEKEGKQDIKK